MPRSSRGSTAHRGHRTRGKQSEHVQETATVGASPEAPVAGTDGKIAESAQPSAGQQPAPRVATPPLQPVTATVSGATLRGADPLLNKELIRISVLAGVVLISLIVITTLLR
jgi:hypothetical protein